MLKQNNHADLRRDKQNLRPILLAPETQKARQKDRDRDAVVPETASRVLVN